MSDGAHSIALLLAYDGRPFGGWQRHPGRTTIQGAVEEALGELVGEEVTIEGSGRTDRGAHADGQVATARVPAGTDLGAMALALSERLAPHIDLRALREVPPGFHARHAALGKTYRYEIFQGGDLPEELEMLVWHVRRPLSWRAMAEAAQQLVGTHDFSTFAANTGAARASSVRTITEAHVEAADERLTLWFSADGFLYKMVRAMVQALARVGEGKASAEDVARALAARDRAASPGAAPASGLYLESVHYEVPLFEREPQDEEPEAQDGSEHAPPGENHGDEEP